MLLSPALHIRAVESAETESSVEASFTNFTPAVAKHPFDSHARYLMSQASLTPSVIIKISVFSTALRGNTPKEQATKLANA